MRRLLVFCVVLLMFAALLLAGPAERFIKTHTMIINAEGETYLVIPTFNGVGFSPEKFTAHGYINDAIVTMYLPLNMGPAGASDSFTVTVYLYGAADNMWDFNYYGPMSDTMRVESGAASGSAVFINFYGN